MKLSIYLIKSYLLILFSTLLIVTFTMCLLSIPKLVSILSKGVSLSIILSYFTNLIFYFFSYSIPISALFSSLLLFGKLSTDGELSAMKSSGLSLWQISSPIIVISILLSIFCIYNNGFVYPNKRYENRILLKKIDFNDPIKILEEGRSIRDFPGYIIYIKNKNNNEINDLVVYELNKEDASVKSCIQANNGSIKIDDENKQLTIELFNARIERLDRNSNDNRYASANYYSIPIDISDWKNNKKLVKNRRDMTIFELIHNANEYDNQRFISSELWVRVHQRLYLGLAPLTFVLIGIPLGIKSHRKESSKGMIYGLLIVFIYYCLILISDGLDHKPELIPWIIPWIGSIFYQIMGFFFINKIN